MPRERVKSVNRQVKSQARCDAFVAAYFAHKLNASAAARSIGLPINTAMDMLKRPYVQEQIKLRQAANAERLAGEEDLWVAEVRAIAFSDIRTLFEHREVEVDDEEGEDDEEEPKPKNTRRIIALKDVTELPKEIAAAIASIKTRKISAARSESGHPEILTEVKLWDKPNALKLYGEYNGYVKTQGKGDGDTVVHVELQQSIQQTFGDGSDAETSIKTIIPHDEGKE